MGRRTWTPELVEKLRECADAKMTRAEAAEAFGLSLGGVKKAATRYNVRFSRRTLFVEGNELGKRAKRHGPLPKPKPPKPPKPPRIVVPEPPKAPVSEDDAIARYIAERGVTRCPPAFVLPSQQAALDEAEIAAKLRSVTTLDTKLRPGESRRNWYRRVGGTHGGRATP